MRRTYYIYKGYDRENALAIIAPNVNKERHVAELKRLVKENGHITIRNCLGGLVFEITEEGKINFFCLLTGKYFSGLTLWKHKLKNEVTQ